MIKNKNLETDRRMRIIKVVPVNCNEDIAGYILRMLRESEFESATS